MKFLPGFKSNKGFGKTSYSQCGEDLIVNFVFEAIGVSHPSYLDLGAHHFAYLSNTYFFYQRGSKGVCVEPDPSLFAEIKKRRKRDICLNVGVGVCREEVADFYILSGGTLSTFSRKEAEIYQSYGTHKIERVIQMPLVGVNEIMDQTFTSGPNFVSLDIEGLDLQVLRDFDFSRHRPQVFCVETITYTEDNSERKVSGITDLMQMNGYFAYADTYVNTIFVEQEVWGSR
jgi:FkbM family methyltransferase